MPISTAYRRPTRPALCEHDGHPTSLTERERRVLEVLLRPYGKEVDLFRPQVEALQVVSPCKCGCPTIDFSTPGRDGGVLRVVAEAIVRASRATASFFVTSQNDLTPLEYVGVSNNNPEEFPDPEILVVSRTLRPCASSCLLISAGQRPSSHRQGPPSARTRFHRRISNW